MARRCGVRSWVGFARGARRGWVVEWGQGGVVRVVFAVGAAVGSAECHEREAWDAFRPVSIGSDLRGGNGGLRSLTWIVPIADHKKRL